MTKERIIQILRQILEVEDIELKNCAIESLIDSLEDLDILETYEDSDRKGRTR